MKLSEGGTGTKKGRPGSAVNNPASAPGPGIVSQASAMPVTAPPKNSGTRPASSGGGGGGGSRGGGGGGYSGGGSHGGSSSYSATPAAPAMPSIKSYLLGDTTYQDQLAQLRKAYTDYVANQNLSRTNYQNQYGLNVRDLTKQRTQGLQDVTDDFASRGLSQSGLYGQAYADAQSEYDRRQTELDTARNAFLTDLAQQLSNFKGDQQTATTSAKQEAIARRAAQYGG